MCSDFLLFSSSSTVVDEALARTRTGMTRTTPAPVTSSDSAPSGSTKLHGAKRYSISVAYCEKSRTHAPRSAAPTRTASRSGSGLSELMPV